MATKKRQDRKQEINKIDIPDPNPTAIKAILQQKSLIEIQDDFIYQRYSSFDLLVALIRQTIDIGMTLNLVSDVNFQFALQRARQCDIQRRQSIKNGQTLSILHGIPISIKDQISIKGTQSNWCRSSNLDTSTKEQNAKIIQILLKLGAIPFVKSTTPINPSIFTKSYLWGVAKNPWDIRRTSGGSSGGEAGLISSNCSIIGLGTDSAGSVRIPASYCGLVGFYPTPSRMPYGKSGGMYPNQKNLANFIKSVPGPIGRNVSDIQSVMRAIYSEQTFKMDYSVLPMPYDDEIVQNQGEQLKVGVWVDQSFIKNCPTMNRSLESAIEILEQRGYKVIRDFKFKYSVRQIFRVLMKIWTIDQGKTMAKQLIKEPVWDKSIQSSIEFSNKSQKDINTTIKQLEQLKDRLSGFLIPNQDGYEYCQSSMQLRQAMLQIFHDFAGIENGQMVREGVDLILSPASPVPAPYIDCPPHIFMTICYFTLANLVDFPAGTVPATTVLEGEDNWDPVRDSGDVDDMLSNCIRQTMKGSVGMPMSVQVFGKPCRDEVVIQVMKDLEEGFQFDKRPKAI